MDWETFFQGLKDTRTGGGLFVVTLLLFLFAALVVPLLAEGVTALCVGLWTWAGAVITSVLDFGLSVDFLEVASIAARGTFLLSLVGLAALALIITRDHLQRSTVPVAVQNDASRAPAPERGLSQTAARLDSIGRLRVGTTRAPFWLRPRRAGSDQIRRIAKTRLSARDPQREDS